MKKIKKYLEIQISSRLIKTSDQFTLYQRAENLKKKNFFFGRVFTKNSFTKVKLSNFLLPTLLKFPIMIHASHSASTEVNNLLLNKNNPFIKSKNFIFTLTNKTLLSSLSFNDCSNKLLLSYNKNISFLNLLKQYRNL